MARSIATKAKRAITQVAQCGARGVKSVAADALGAAAKAAAGVVLVSTAKALATGRTKVEQSIPAMERAIGKAAVKTVRGRPRTKSSGNRRVTKGKRRSRRVLVS
jgi:hypothetical protein